MIQTFRIWLGHSLYLLRKADSEDNAVKQLTRRQRQLVTKVEPVRSSSEWREAK